MTVNRKDRLILQLNVVPVGAARCSVHENEVDVSVNSPIRRCGKAARKNIPHFAVCSVKRVPVRVAGKKRIVFAGRLASVFVYVFNRSSAARLAVSSSSSERGESSFPASLSSVEGSSESSAAGYSCSAASTSVIASTVSSVLSTPANTDVGSIETQSTSAINRLRFFYSYFASPLKMILLSP